MAGISARFHGDMGFEHQVFLSFRGEDVRNIFAGHLHTALKFAGFRVFMDNDGLDHGEDIQQKLYEAIESSQLSVVTLSPRYADSRWCLDELVKIMDLRGKFGHGVLPVFYDVEPTEVRNQKGLYAEAFRLLEEQYEVGRVEKWRSALKQVAALRGLSLQQFNGDGALLVEGIIQLVKHMADRRQLYIPPHINVDNLSILDDISHWLRHESEEVEVGLIYGWGGVGKTTIAQIAYNYNLHNFDHCSFLADFTRKSKLADGLTGLLEQLISDITGKPGNKIYNFDKGLTDVRAVLSSRRVLVVLDGVDDIKQLPAAFNDPNFFGAGSKIIITSKNRNLRKVAMVKAEFKATVWRKVEDRIDEVIDDALEYFFSFLE